MKLKKICTILFITLLVLTTTVLGYTTDNYSIDVKEEYEMREDEGIVMFQNPTTGDNIVVQELAQVVIGGKLSTYQLNSIISEMTNQYKDMYDADVEQLGKEEITINGRTVTKMSFKTDLLGTAVYQELNIFVTSDKIYDIIFTSTSENGFSNEEKSNVLASFKILGEETSSENNVSANSQTESSSKLSLAWIELGVVIIIAIILTVIGLKRNPKSKKFILAIIFLALQALAIKGAETENETADYITSNVAFNIGYFTFAIIALILLIIPIVKKPKKVAENKEKVDTVNNETIKEVEENKNELNSSDDEEEK